jgi:RNA 2',3'-cyclic 3'-phosphodiesterase
LFALRYEGQPAQKVETHTVRLFVALDIPDTVSEALAKLSRQLRETGADARWVRIEGAHVTLKFIGETPLDRVERIRAALGEAGGFGPIDLHFAGLGFFPNARRPRVLWAGVTAGPALSALAAAIETRLEPLGIPREARGFSPHITLARFDSSKGLGALRAAVEKLGAPEFGHARAVEFHLYQSVLKRGGAEYTRLASYQISGEPAS